MKNKKPSERIRLLKQGIKICKVCGETKAIEQFPHYSRTCKSCRQIIRDKKNFEKNSILIAAKLEKEQKRKEKEAHAEEYKNQLAEKQKLLDEGYKQCSKCGEIKPIDQFTISHRSKPLNKVSAYRGACKACLRKIFVEQYTGAKPLFKKCVICGTDIPNVAHKYCALCRKQVENRRNQERKRKSRQKNRNIWLRDKIRKIVNEHLRGKKNAHGSFRYTGCSIQELRAWIESQFQEGMSWENSGLWHLDHYVPVSYFDLTNPEEVKICFNWRNLQPLWAEENVEKSNTLPDDYLIRIEEIKQHLTPTP